MNQRKTINVLYILEYSELGGGETSFIHFMNALDKIKYHPLVIVPAEGQLSQSMREMNVETEILDLPRITLASNCLMIVSKIRYLNELCKRYKINIIHTHSFNSLFYIAYTRIFSRIPIIWTCHGWWPANRLTGMFINIIAKSVIAVSFYVYDKLIHQGKVAKTSVRVIHLGLDMDHFQINTRTNIREELNIEDSTFVIGMISRYQEIKGHRYFVQAAGIVTRHIANCKFIVVGSTVFNKPEDLQYMRSIFTLITDLGLNEEIILTGFRADIPQILQSIDLLVVPSQMETFGMVVVEAMAMGIPVVASHIGGILDIIDDGETGFFVPVANPEAIAERILHLETHREQLKRISNTATVTAHNKFNIKGLVGQSEHVYENLIIN